MFMAETKEKVEAHAMPNLAKRRNKLKAQRPEMIAEQSQAQLSERPRSPVPHPYTAKVNFQTD